MKKDNIQGVNIRFNLDREQHRRAWEILNQYDRQKYHSYADIIAAALIALADDGTPASFISEKKMQEIVAGFADRLSEAVIEILRASIPAFLAGCAMQNAVSVEADKQAQGQPEYGNNIIPEDEIDWAFLGEG